MALVEQVVKGDRVTFSRTDTPNCHLDLWIRGSGTLKIWKDRRMVYFTHEEVSMIWARIGQYLEYGRFVKGEDHD